MLELTVLLGGTVGVMARLMVRHGNEWLGEVGGNDVRNEKVKDMSKPGCCVGISCGR